MNYKITILIGLALMAGPLGVAGEVFKVSFPGTSEAPDPSGRYSIIWSYSKRHDLFFKNLKTDKQHHLLTFNRHVDMLWSPDGNAFAITDWGGSDYSEVLVYSTVRLNKPINLQDVLKKSFGSLPEVQKNHHVYFEALDWSEPWLLRFKVHGYGDYSPGGFDILFKYKLKENKVTKTE
jgi:hypothetical protein